MGLTLKSLETFVDDYDRSRIRDRIISFWIRVADLTGTEKISRALVYQYKQMRSLRFRFLTAYWALLAIMFGIICVELYPAQPSAFGNAFRTELKVDLLVRSAFIFANPGGHFEVREKDCIPIDDGGWQKELHDFIAVGSGYDHLITKLERDYPQRLRLLVLATFAITIAVLGVPLSIALLISFRVTLWLLARFTKSAMKLTSIVALDVLAALVVPQFLASLMFLVASSVLTYLAGGVFDFVSLGVANERNLVCGSVAVALDLAWSQFLIPILFFYEVPSWVFRAMVSWAPLWMVVLSTYERSIGFFVDAGLVLRGNFSPSYIDATRNWAIAIDLAFSATYLVPCLLLVFAERSPFAKRVFLNFVQAVAEHKPGPIAAIGDLCLWMVRAFTSLFTGK